MPKASNVTDELNASPISLLMLDMFEVSIFKIAGCMMQVGDSCPILT